LIFEFVSEFGFRIFDLHKKFVTEPAAHQSPLLKGADERSDKMKQNMKRNLLTIAAVGAIAVTGLAFAKGQAGPAGHACAGHGHGFALEHLTKSLNLTSDQQAKVQPIIDAARPQIVAIHQDAMQKTQTVISNAATQIRPLLNTDQQKKFDDIQKAHQDLINAMKEMHSAEGE
jgi:Spy/CpxP family protein refolding chaperone